MSLREQLLSKLRVQHNKDASTPPVVTLSEYFDGNTDEECIAPNQVGYGRPALADLVARLREIAAKPEVEAVFVGIHSDWLEETAATSGWPPAENIHIFTSATEEEVEVWIAELAADGVIEEWPYGKHPSAPSPSTGYRIFSICWD